MKYVLPIVNCVIICSLCIIVHIRDGTPIIGVLEIIGIVALNVYLLKLMKNNGNSIKIATMNKMWTIICVFSIICCGYEFATGTIISNEVGDCIAIILAVILIGILVYDYWIKPFKKQ